MCTLTCDLASLRSAVAACSTPAVAASSQNAWMEMRGIGRALTCAGTSLGHVAGRHQLAAGLGVLLGDGKGLLAHLTPRLVAS